MGETASTLSGTQTGEMVWMSSEVARMQDWLTGISMTSTALSTGTSIELWSSEVWVLGTSEVWHHTSFKKAFQKVVPWNLGELE